MSEGGGSSSNDLVEVGINDDSLAAGLNEKRKLDNDADESDSNKIRNPNADGQMDTESIAIADTDLLILQSRIRYLERKNYLLQKLVDAKEVLVLQVGQILATRCGHSSSTCQPNTLLPDNGVKEIMKNISDQKTLQDSRLVCTQWNRIIEDASEVMKNITLPVWHPKLFLDLAIVKNGKVRSISFKNCTPLEWRYHETCMDTISSTVEKVKFDFDDDSSQQQSSLVKLVLEKCNNIQELWFEGARNLFLEMPSALVVAAANQISCVSADIHGLSEQHAICFTELLLKLPQLKEINLRLSYYGLTWGGFSATRYSDLQCALKILTGVCDYIKKYETALQLKKLTVPFERIEAEHQELSLLLVCLCGKDSIVLHKLTDINLNNLLTLTEPEIVAGFSRPGGRIFSSEIGGVVTFEGPALKNLSRFNSLHISELELTFKRNIMKGELQWMEAIQHRLESLTLDTNFYPVKNKRLDGNSIKEFENSLSSGLTSLKSLRIINDMFDSLRIINWAQYFPNLHELNIVACDITPNYLIADLTVLESLSYLLLRMLQNLEDEAFTTETVNKFATNNGESSSLLAPAIACFKSLKYLKIAECSSVTNLCVIDGIAKCVTLEGFRIFSCCQMTPKCKKYVTCQVSFDDDIEDDDFDDDDEDNSDY